MNFSDLSDRELLVMKCLWDTGAPMTVSELIAYIKDKYDIAYKETTVYTFLKRLRDKEYVTSVKKGSSRFSPAVDEASYLNQYAAVMAEFWNKDASAIFLSAYCRSLGLTAEEWNGIRA